MNRRSFLQGILAAPLAPAAAQLAPPAPVFVLVSCAPGVWGPMPLADAVRRTSRDARQLAILVAYISAYGPVVPERAFK